MRSLRFGLRTHYCFFRVREETEKLLENPSRLSSSQRKRLIDKDLHDLLYFVAPDRSMCSPLNVFLSNVYKNPLVCVAASYLGRAVEFTSCGGTGCLA